MNIKGKEYTEVKDRITVFREKHPDWSIATNLEWHNEDMSAVLFRCVVSSPSVGEAFNVQTFTGYAYEERITASAQFNDVNYSSWVENAETSAIGRALANMGYQGSAQRPAAEEMQKVERVKQAAQQQVGEPPKTETVKAKTIGTKRSMLDRLSADISTVKAIVGHDKYFQQALANRKVDSMDKLPYNQLAELVESFGSFASQLVQIRAEFEEKDPDWRTKLEELAEKMKLLL
jgi:hypothetical protein